MVKKFSGEQFPRYIKYTRDGDDYELEFDEFVK
jgi:raw score 10.82